MSALDPQGPIVADNMGSKEYLSFKCFLIFSGLAAAQGSNFGRIAMLNMGESTFIILHFECLNFRGNVGHTTPLSFCASIVVTGITLFVMPCLLYPLLMADALDIVWGHLDDKQRKLLQLLPFMAGFYLD